jgi:SAM-dependent methyltransferase
VEQQSRTSGPNPHLQEYSVKHTIGLEKAALYEQWRLPYADGLARDVLKHVGEVSVVVDLAAGTGQLARLFADRCRLLLPVEPDPAMRRVATKALAEFDAVRIVAGLAENLPFAQNSVDLIVIGNAFHRFRPEACGEVRRVLRRKGWVALISYEFTNMAFAGMLFSELAKLRGIADRIEETWHRVSAQDLFGSARIYELAYAQSQTEDWTAFFGAACAGIEAPSVGDADFAAFGTLNRQVFEAFSVDGKIQIDYQTRVSYAQPLMAFPHGPRDAFQA